MSKPLPKKKSKAQANEEARAFLSCLKALEDEMGVRIECDLWLHVGDKSNCELYFVHDHSFYGGVRVLDVDKEPGPNTSGKLVPFRDECFTESIKRQNQLDRRAINGAIPTAFGTGKRR